MKLKTDYRIAKESTAGVSEQDLPWKVVEGVFHDWGICPVSQRPVLLRVLTRGQRAFLFIGNFMSQMLGDGFFLYLWNTGEEVSGLLVALRVIGAKDYLPIFQSALRLFKNRAVLKSVRLRRASLNLGRKAQIDDRFERAFDNLNERNKTSLHSFLLAYLDSHPDDFLVSAAASRAAAQVETDYRLPREKVESLRGKRLHWALIEPMWDDYFEARRAGEDDFSEFLAKLSLGQRALVAINIFTKNVLCLGGFRAEFANPVARNELFHREVRDGYALLGATDYVRLVACALARSEETHPETEALDAKLKEGFAERERRKLRVGTKAMADHLSRFTEFFNQKTAIQGQLDIELNKLSTEFKCLCDSRKTKIERYIEAYVASHPAEFIRV